MNNPYGTVWESPAKAPSGEPYLSVFNNDGFYCAHRAGTDSIAFVLWDNEKKKWGMLRCRHGGTGFIENRTFTGSLDREYDRQEMQEVYEVVKQEAREEAGYTVSRDRIKFMGTYEVGHMIDEYVHLFYIDVTHLVPEEIELTDPLEQRDLIGTVWVGEMRRSKDWKAELIEKIFLFDPCIIPML